MCTLSDWFRASKTLGADLYAQRKMNSPKQYSLVFYEYSGLSRKLETEKVFNGKKILHSATFDHASQEEED